MASTDTSGAAVKIVVTQRRKNPSFPDQNLRDPPAKLVGDGVFINNKLTLLDSLKISQKYQIKGYLIT